MFDSEHSEFLPDHDSTLLQNQTNGFYQHQIMQINEYRNPLLASRDDIIEALLWQGRCTKRRKASIWVDRRA
jgi:hypothetical protein